MVTAGLALSTLGCTIAFRKDSKDSDLGQSQYWSVVSAVWFFLLSINTAGIANAIEERAAWLEVSLFMVWVQMVYLILYSSMLIFSLLEVPADQRWGVPAFAICAMSGFWAFLFGRPKVFICTCSDIIINI
jgi:hypothetical protein